jgi:hypothetical protein
MRAVTISRQDLTVRRASGNKGSDKPIRASFWLLEAPNCESCTVQLPDKTSVSGRLCQGVDCDVDGGEKVGHFGGRGRARALVAGRDAEGTRRETGAIWRARFWRLGRRSAWRGGLGKTCR